VLTERFGWCVLAIAPDSRRIETSETVYNIRWFYPMPIADAGLTKARQVFTKHRGMLRTSDAIRLGVHPRTLYNLRDRGELEQVGRGIYRLSTAPPLTSPDLVSVAIRAPRAVICLISALAHHGLTTQVPHAVDVALLSHAQVPRIDGIPLRVFWYSEPSFSAGIDIVLIDQVPVRVYSPEKTIADCFKYRNKIGLDVAIEALRTYRERARKPDYRALSRFAKVDRVEKVTRPYLEAML
jgi:predicted transcriptional regulator of viral defense system